MYLKIYAVHGDDSERISLTFQEADRLATKAEYENGNREIGSFFKSLEEGGIVELADGLYVLDEQLDLLDLVEYGNHGIE